MLGGRTRPLPFTGDSASVSSLTLVWVFLMRSSSGGHTVRLCYSFCKTLYGICVEVTVQLVCVFPPRLKQKVSIQPLTLELSMQKNKQDALMKEN